MMKQFLSFVKKEFIHILRDPRSLLILMAMPLIMVILLGYVIKTDVDDIRVAVLDQSRDYYTKQITDRIAANGYFVYNGYVATEDDATSLFRKGEIDLVIVFGPEFANRLLHSKDASIQILSDGSEPNQASVRVTYAQQVIASFQKELREKMASNATAQPNGGVPQFNINVSSRLLFNPQQRSEVNFVPAVIGIILMLICCMMTSVSIVREREMGTMEVLLASPLSSLTIVFAKIVPYFVISAFNLTVILLFIHFVMEVPMAGSLFSYLLVSVIFIFVVLMIGLFISTCTSNQLAAMLISLLLIVPSLYLSDMIFSLNSMHPAVQAASNIVPAKWFISASRKIMIEGVELRYVAKEIFALCAQGVVFLLLSWKFFKTRLE